MPPTKTCTLSLVVRYTGREEVHARTRPLTHASIFFSKRRMMTPGLCIWESHTQIIEIYRVQCFDVSRQLVHQREV